MKGLGLSLAACLGLALGAGVSQAQPNCGCYYPPIPQAPDGCGPGFYWANNSGMVYGPGYFVRPPYPPFQGMVFPPKPPGGPGGAGPLDTAMFGTHPYARSPRDFFMYYDKDEPSYPPSFSWANYSGMGYGGDYFVRPPYPPFQR